VAEEIGVGYVRLVPSMEGFQAKAQQQLRQSIAPGAKAAGAAAGTEAASGFTSSVGKGLGKAQGKFKGFLSKIGGGAAGALAGFVAVGAIKDAIGGAVSAASDLNETLNKSQAIFGKQQASMLAWADTASTSVGLSKGAALDAAAGFGDMFTQIGFTGKAAAGMSRDTVQLAADLGSFSNLETADVVDRLSGAFRGEYDSLQLVIPNINAARVEQVALATTGKKTAKELTAQEKAAAVLAIAHKDGARAAGDFAKTSSGLANSQKIMSAEVTNLKADIGAGLLPVMLKLQVIGLKAVRWMADNQGVLKTTAIIVGGVLAGAFAALAVSVIAATWPFLAIGAAVALLAAGFVWLWKNSETTRTVITAVGKAFVAVFKWIMSAGSAFFGWLKGAFSALVSAATSYGKLLFKIYTWPYVQSYKIIKATLQAVGRFIKGVFSTVVRAGVSMGQAILNGFRKLRALAGYLTSPLRAGIRTAKDLLGGLVSYVRGLPGKFRSAMSGLWNSLTSGFRSALNFVIGKWNGLSFTIGGQKVFGKTLPGVTISTPNIPYLASGGIIDSATLAVVGESGPEVVTPLSQLGSVAAAAGAAPPTVVMVDGSGLDRALAEWLRRSVRVRGGGSVQTAFGSTR
jgi:hypothetical protein